MLNSITPDLMLSPFQCALFVLLGRWLGTHPDKFYEKTAKITPRRAALVRRFGIVMVFLGIGVPAMLWADYFRLGLITGLPVGLLGAWLLQPAMTAFERTGKA
jgi:hypothetical protein